MALASVVSMLTARAGKALAFASYEAAVVCAGETAAGDVVDAIVWDSRGGGDGGLAVDAAAAATTAAAAASIGCIMCVVVRGCCKAAAATAAAAAAA